MNKVLLNTIIAAIAMTAVTTSASAETSKIKGLYFGTGITALKGTSATDPNALKGTSPEIHVGYAVNDNVSLEYRRYLNDVSLNNDYVSNQSHVTGTDSIKNIQSFLIKSKIDYNNFNVGLIGGYSLATFNADYTNTAIAPAVFATTRVVDSISLKGFTYGVSAGYSFNKNVSLNAEYLHVLNNKGLKLTGFGTNIEYKF